MSLPSRPSSRFSALLARCDSRSGVRLAMWLVPLLLGLFSLRLGQDDNWDLKNYHIYNPFAFLNGKIGVDLAPAQWQSYFNPTLDLLYYGMTSALPAPLAGFLMGVMHGLNFLLVFAIGRQLLPSASRDAGFRVPLLLALAGVMGTAFLAQLGNSMGDNMTSLFVLAALLLVLRCGNAAAAGVRRGTVGIAAAGLLMGVGCGLKLTNATYALALCISLLTLPGTTVHRLRIAFLFGIAVLAGIAISAGHWFVLMYQTFGNPLFPQFNDQFLAPLAAPIGIGDTGWLPKNLAERLLWPFLFASDSRRVGELPLRLWLWPVIYVAMLIMPFKLALAARRAAAPPPQAGGQRLLLVFFALSYLAWLNLFSIYRYLVPLELLLPLLLWLVMARLLPSPWAGRLAATLIVVGVIAGIPRASWRHAGWTRTAFSAEVPAFPQPQENMVFTVHGDPPMGWLVTQFPTTLAFAALGSGFPESAAFAARVKQMAAARKGPLFVMLQADRAAPTALRSAGELAQALAANQETLAKGAEVLARYDFVLDAASCRMHPAFIGKSHWNYQLCVVTIKGIRP